jgi:uncharacterized protein (TIGR02118 family)
MIKLLFCLRRLPHLSRDEFQRYWRETHGPLVARHAETLRIRRYIQVHTRTDEINSMLRASRGGPEEFDGVAEIWWRDREELLAAVASEAGQRASQELLEDERRFIDLAQSPVSIADEIPILSG